MTNEIFDNIKNRIKNDSTAVKSNWYDGHKWTDTAGNWFGWTDCGYCEYLFYAGEKWTRYYDASGKPTEPERIAAYPA